MVAGSVIPCIAQSLCRPGPSSARDNHVEDKSFQSHCYEKFCRTKVVVKTAHEEDVRFVAVMLASAAVSLGVAGSPNCTRTMTYVRMDRHICQHKMECSRGG